jgi:membrane-bound lytic murein transglycosylase B
MGKAPARLTEPEHARRIAEGVRAWQRNSIKKRMPLEKLAKKLAISLAQVKRVLNKPEKRLRRATERLDLRKAVKERAKKQMKQQIRRDTATKIIRDLKLKTLSVRAAQRERKPTRDKIQKWRRKMKDVNIDAAMEYMRRTSLPRSHPEYEEPTPPPATWYW